jgi:hypothetical protein
MDTSKPNSTNNTPQPSPTYNPVDCGNLPSLLMVPVFDKNSSWPSYIVKPIYNNVVNEISKMLETTGHSYHNINNQPRMFPTVPTYIPGKKIGEKIPQIIYPPSTSEDKYVSIPLDPTPMSYETTADREKQLWYYKTYQPKMYDSMV